LLQNSILVNKTVKKVKNKSQDKKERLMDDKVTGPILNALYDRIRRDEVNRSWAIQGGTVHALNKDALSELVKQDPTFEYLFSATNLTPIAGELCYVEEPHTPHNTITNTKSIVLKAENMAEKIRTLIGKPIHITAGFTGHSEDDEDGGEKYTTVGVVLGAYYSEGENGKTIQYVGGLHELDFPSEVGAIVSSDSGLGNSYEALAPKSGIKETKDSVIIDDYEFTGLAILRKDMAAFPETGVRLIAVKQKTDETVPAEKWSASFMNDLPDSAFLLVRKPVKDKQKDRALPIRSKSGKLDKGQVVIALAQIDQVKGFSREDIAVAKKRLIGSAKELGISVSEKNSGGNTNMSEEAKVLAGKVTELETALAEKDTKIEALDAQVIELTEKSSKFEELEATITELKANAEKGEDGEKSEIEVLQSKVSDLETELTASTEAKDTAEGELADVKAQTTASEEWEKIKDKYPEDSKESVVAALIASQKGQPLTAEHISALTSKKPEGLKMGKSTIKSGEQTPEDKEKMRARFGIKKVRGGDE